MSETATRALTVFGRGWLFGLVAVCAVIASSFGWAYLDSASGAIYLQLFKYSMIMLGLLVILAVGTFVFNRIENPSS